MSEDGRKIFSTDQILALFAGKNEDDAREVMRFALNGDVCEKGAAVVGPMLKGWLMGLHPELAKISIAGAGNFGAWVNELKQKLGDNISLPPMPAEDSKGILGVLETIKAAKTAVEEKVEEAKAIAVELAAAKKEISLLAPFKEKAEKLTATVASLEEKAKSAVAEIATLKKTVTAFDGKVAIDETGLESAIKDIVKKAVGSMSFAGAAGAAEADEPEAPASGGVPDDFGFGTSGASDDGFGF